MAVTELKVGDLVAWVSSNKKKTGQVVAIVHAGTDVWDVIRAREDLEKITFQYGGGARRDVTSYIIKVPTPRSAKLYWPYPSLLVKI